MFCGTLSFRHGTFLFRHRRIFWKILQNVFEKLKYTPRIKKNLAESFWETQMYSQNQNEFCIYGNATNTVIILIKRVTHFVQSFLPFHHEQAVIQKSVPPQEMNWCLGMMREHGLKYIMLYQSTSYWYFYVKKEKM